MLTNTVDLLGTIKSNRIHQVLFENLALQFDFLAEKL
jgi:hypothetical protein